MEKETNSNAVKVRDAAAEIMGIFEERKFSFSEASATMQLCWSLMLVDMQQQFPQIISQEPKMIDNFGEVLKDTIAFVRERYAEEE